MAIGVKTTLYYSAQDGMGFSESFQNLTASTLSEAELAAIVLAKKRLALCGNSVSLVGARLSDSAILGQRKSKMVSFFSDQRGYVDIPNSRQFTGGSQAEFDAATTDEISDCVVVEMITVSGQKAFKYISGVPDDVRDQDEASGINFVGHPKWHDNYTAWVDELTNSGVGGQWGIRVRRNDQPVYRFVDIINWQNRGTTPNQIGLVVPGNTTQYPATQYVQISGVRANIRGLAVPKGQYRIAASANGTEAGTSVFYLYNTADFDISDFSNPGRVRLVGYDGSAIKEISVVRSGSHGRGKRAGLRAGRRPTR